MEVSDSFVQRDTSAEKSRLPKQFVSQQGVASQI